MENKKYKLSTGVEVAQKPLKVKTIYAILKLLMQVKGALKVDLSDAAALQNVQFTDLIDAIVDSDLFGSFLNIILHPVNATDKIDFTECEFDDAFLEVVQDFFSINKNLPKVWNLIKSAWGGMNTTLN